MKIKNFIFIHKFYKLKSIKNFFIDFLFLLRMNNIYCYLFNFHKRVILKGFFTLFFGILSGTTLLLEYFLGIRSNIESFNCSSLSFFSVGFFCNISFIRLLLLLGGGGSFSIFLGTQTFRTGGCIICFGIITENTFQHRII